MLRPNWFFGFPVGGRFVLDLPEPPPGFRRFHPADVHLTVAFLGGCERSTALSVSSRLERLLREMSLAPIPISLAEVVPMGRSRNAYSALSALLGDGRTAAITLLQSLQNPLLEAAALKPEQRPPKPHVTLARPRRRATSIERDAGLAWAQRLDLSAVRGTLDRIALYTWHFERSERLFEIVAEHRLPHASDPTEAVRASEDARKGRSERDPP